MLSFLPRDFSRSVAPMTWLLQAPQALGQAGLWGDGGLHPDTRTKAEPGQKAPVLAVQGVSRTEAGPGLLSSWAGCFLVTVEATISRALRSTGVCLWPFNYDSGPSRGEPLPWARLSFQLAVYSGRSPAGSSTRSRAGGDRTAGSSASPRPVSGGPLPGPAQQARGMLAARSAGSRPAGTY